MTLANIFVSDRRSALKNVFTFLLGLLCTASPAQNHTIDSLLNVLNKRVQKDTVQVNLYNQLFTAYSKLKNDSVSLQKAYDYAQKAVDLSSEIHFTKGKAASRLNIGTYHFLKRNHIAAFETFQLALKDAENIHDSSLIANLSNKIGYIHHFIAKDHAKAKIYFDRAYNIALYKNDVKNQAKLLTNRGSVASALLDHENALKHYETAFQLFKEIGDSSSLALVAGNMGENYLILKQLNKAQKFFMLSKNISEKLHSEYQVMYNEERLGKLHFLLNENNKAESILLNCYNYAFQNHKLELIKNSSEILWHLYAKTGDTLKAIVFQNKFILARDSMSNEEKRNLIAAIENTKAFEKLEITKAAELKILEAEHANAEFRQNFILICVAVILLITGVALFITLQRHKLTLSQKKIIESQKTEVEAKNLQIGIKQKEILDSIRYARNIQRALITNEKYIEKQLSRLNKKNKL